MPRLQGGKGPGGEKVSGRCHFPRITQFSDLVFSEAENEVQILAIHGRKTSVCKSLRILHWIVPIFRELLHF